jgi:hypothetical protein
MPSAWSPTWARWPGIYLRPLPWRRHPAALVRYVGHVPFPSLGPAWDLSRREVVVLTSWLPAECNTGFLVPYLNPQISVRDDSSMVVRIRNEPHSRDSLGLI